MSKHNKANKSNYVQAGRLTADEMGRERERQGNPSVGAARQRAREEIKGRGDDRPGAPGSSRRRSGRGESG
jgi:hypothetical protein